MLVVDSGVATVLGVGAVDASVLDAGTGGVVLRGWDEVLLTGVLETLGVGDVDTNVEGIDGEVDLIVEERRVEDIKKGVEGDTRGVLEVLEGGVDRNGVVLIVEEGIVAA